MRRDGEPVYNATVERASIVIESLLSNARHSVDILTGTLAPEVYGRDPVIKEAQFFLLTSPENRIRIIWRKTRRASGCCIPCSSH